MPLDLSGDATRKQVDDIISDGRSVVKGEVIKDGTGLAAQGEISREGVTKSGKRWGFGAVMGWAKRRGFIGGAKAEFEL